MTVRAVRPLAVLLVVLVVASAPVAALAAADPYRPSQWGLERIAAPAAWGVARGEGQVIAVIDSGVDLAHPDLIDRFVRDAAGNILGKDYIDGDAVPQDRNGHGTMVAGIAAATEDNGIGVAGAAPEAEILPVRVLDAQGRGSAADVDAAIRWAVDNGATVINLSLESVAPLPGTIVSQAPEAAVQYAWERGVVVVAAAGNSGAGFTDYADSSPVLLVGATDREDQLAPFSDNGRRDAVLAPGVEIISTWCDPTPGGCDQEHPYGQADGTSFAAPSVSAAIAILRATGRSAEDAVERLRASAVDLGPAGADSRHGHGRIDVAAAVSTGDVEGPASPTERPDATASPTPAGTQEPATPAPGTAAPPSATPSGTPIDDPTSVPSATPVATIPPPDEDVTPISTPPETSALGGPAGGHPGDRRDDLLRLAAALLVLTSGLVWDVVRRGPATA